MHIIIYVVWVGVSISALYKGNTEMGNVFLVGFVLLGALITIWIEVINIKDKLR